MDVSLEDTQKKLDKALKRNLEKQSQKNQFKKTEMAQTEELEETIE